MASFKNKETGVILTTENKNVIAQLKNNPAYAPCKAPKSAKPATKADDVAEDQSKEPTADDNAEE